MIKRIILAVLTAAVLVSCNETAQNYPLTIAHRGCWMSDQAQTCDAKSFVVPENSLESVQMAARYGYQAVECDPRFTSDSIIVCMHDQTINRTMMQAFYGKGLEEPVYVKDLSLVDLKMSYLFKSVNKEMRTRIPTLREFVTECQECGIMPLVHCDFFKAYPLVQSIVGDNFIAFSQNIETLKKVRGISTCKILLDPGVELKNRGLEDTPANILALLDEIGGDCGISSMKHDMCRAEICQALTEKGHDVQSSIFASPAELDAVRNGVTILLSDYCWWPSKNIKPAEKFSEKVNGSAEWKGHRIEYGALTVEMSGCGQWDVVVNGEKTYSINRETPGTEIVTTRYYDREASVSLEVKSGKVSLSVKNYSL